MRASKNPEKWHELLRCVDNGDFNTANKIAIKFFGGTDEIYVSKEQKVKDEFLLFLFQTNKIDELNGELKTQATDQTSLLNELKDCFEKEIGFLVLNRKYLVKNPLVLVRYFFSEEEINEYLITEKNKKLTMLTQRKLGRLLLFNEQQCEIDYDLQDIKTLSDNELDELMQKHKYRNYIVYDDMLFTDPFEFFVVFGFIFKKYGRKRQFDNERLRKIFNFCEEDSISFAIKDDVDIETVKQSAYKKIETLREYNKDFVRFEKWRKKGRKSADIKLIMDLPTIIADYYSIAINFVNGKGNHFLAKERFKQMKRGA